MYIHPVIHTEQHGRPVQLLLSESSVLFLYFFLLRDRGIIFKQIYGWGLPEHINSRVLPSLLLDHCNAY